MRDEDNVFRLVTGLAKDFVDEAGFGRIASNDDRWTPDREKRQGEQEVLHRCVHHDVTIIRKANLVWDSLGTLR